MSWERSMDERDAERLAADLDAVGRPPVDRGFGPHWAWGVLGAVAVPSLWFAWSVPGATAMLLAIVAAFVLWRRSGSTGMWVSLIVIGLGMGGVLGWQAVTGDRCPAAGTKVFLKEGKPPIGCDDVRASAATMGSFFALIALIGVGIPLYGRRRADEDQLRA